MKNKIDLIEISQDIAKLTHIYQEHHKSEFEHALTGIVNQARKEELAFIMQIQAKPEDYKKTLFEKLEKKSTLIADLEADKQALYIQNFIDEANLPDRIWKQVMENQLEEAGLTSQTQLHQGLKT